MNGRCLIGVEGSLLDKSSGVFTELCIGEQNEALKRVYSSRAAGSFLC